MCTEKCLPFFPLSLKIFSSFCRQNILLRPEWYVAWPLMLNLQIRVDWWWRRKEKIPARKLGEWYENELKHTDEQRLLSALNNSPAFQPPSYRGQRALKPPTGYKFQQKSLKHRVCLQEKNYKTDDDFAAVGRCKQSQCCIVCICLPPYMPLPFISNTIPWRVSWEQRRNY